MANEETAGQQLQPYLSGLEPTAEDLKPREPHQMSPEEFAAHPSAVFHTTHLDLNEGERVLDMKSRKESYDKNMGFSPHIHVGTEQAAIENASRTQLSQRYRPTRLHTFWYTAQKRDPFTVRKDGIPFNGEQTHDDHNYGAVVYANAGEDRGSVSISVADPSRLKNQSHFVREAIAAGKMHEIHPRTWALFNNGTLDNGVKLSPSFVGNVAYKNYAMHQARPKPDPTLWEDKAYKAPLPQGVRYSENGPNLDYIKANAIRKPRA